jgi:hypothetical protein
VPHASGSGNSPQKRKFEMGSFNSMSAGKQTQAGKNNTLQFQLAQQ